MTTDTGQGNATSGGAEHESSEASLSPPSGGQIERADYCSQRCYESALAGGISYAPCPLIPTSIPADQLCKFCGWIIPIFS